MAARRLIFALIVGITVPVVAVETQWTEWRQPFSKYTYLSTRYKCTPGSGSDKGAFYDVQLRNDSNDTLEITTVVYTNSQDGDEDCA